MTKAEKIYQRHLEQKKKNNAAIGRMFHCSREWVRKVIEREEKRRAALLVHAQQIAEENKNSSDSLNDN